VLASAAFELGYVITLAAGLSRGDLSVVYPLARGSAPVLVAAVSTIFLGAATPAPAGRSGGAPHRPRLRRLHRRLHPGGFPWDRARRRAAVPVVRDGADRER